MPRPILKTKTQSVRPKAKQQQVAIDMDTPIFKDVDNESNSIPNTTTLPQHHRPQQLKLPNFLSTPIDNLANYLAPGSHGVVPAPAPRSRSVDRKVRTEGGGWVWNRVHSLDRMKREEASIVSFITSPRSSRAMNMGAVCQVADPYQDGLPQHDLPPKVDETDEGQAEEDVNPSKDSDCLIG